MKNKRLNLAVLILSVICGFSTRTFAQVDVAVLMQKVQELQNKSNELEKKLMEVANGMEKKLMEVEKKETSLPGEIKESLLTPEAFQKKYGKVWVLMAGQNISDLEKDIPNIDIKTLGMNVIPDARGKFLRMANNGAIGVQYDPDPRAPGSYQADQFQGHEHRYNPYKTCSGESLHAPQSAGPGASCLTPTRGVVDSIDSITHGSARVGSETRPKNITVNFYIKVASCVGVAKDPCH